MATDDPSPRYQAYTLANLTSMPYLDSLSDQQIRDIRVVGRVLPFKTDSYVVTELIDWEAVPDDPIFVLNFPQASMLSSEHYTQMAVAVDDGDPGTIHQVADAIRLELNPHPAGQRRFNRPVLDGQHLPGIQHKYRETVLFFPGQGQTCHAYCTFCFRWPQFTGLKDLRFASREVDQLIGYLRKHPEVTDVLITGGDPLIMRTRALRSYLEPLVEAGLPNLRSIRLGSKALGYWPYRFTDDADSSDLLDLFSMIVERGFHFSLMAHFNHHRELATQAVQDAVTAIRATGAQIRTQSPIMAQINDDPEVWARMWQQQVTMGMIPYYMFIARDTGAQRFFQVPLVRAWEVFQEAYQRVSGLARTVRGPSMSALPGKVQILGVTEHQGERLFVLRFLQGRDPDWVQRPFFARFDPEATWLDDLMPPLGETGFFFTERLEEILTGVDKSNLDPEPTSCEDEEQPVTAAVSQEISEEPTKDPLSR